jgi:hypothetical protein
MSSSRRRNPVHRVDMQSAYRTKSRSFSSLAITPAPSSPSSLVRAGGSAFMHPVALMIAALAICLLSHAEKPCETSPCREGGLCLEAIGGDRDHFCLCADGFAGVHCEVQVCPAPPLYAFSHLTSATASHGAAWEYGCFANETEVIRAPCLANMTVGPASQRCGRPRSVWLGDSASGVWNDEKMWLHGLLPCSGVLVQLGALGNEALIVHVSQSASAGQLVFDGDVSLELDVGSSILFDVEEGTDCGIASCGVAPGITLAIPSRTDEILSGETLQYTCTQGSTLNGTLSGEKSVIVYCTSNGTFTGLELVQCTMAGEVCLSSPCQNGGECSEHVSDASIHCACEHGYTGHRCETNVDECGSSPCQSGGTCSDGISSYTCACEPSYTGGQCETLLDPCVSNPCESGNSCIRNGTSFLCLCLAGFTGATCTSDIDECIGDPCENGGTCTNTIGSFACECSPECTGSICNTCDDPKQAASSDSSTMTPIAAGAGAAGVAILLLLLLLGLSRRRNARRTMMHRSEELGVITPMTTISSKEFQETMAHQDSDTNASSRPFSEEERPSSSFPITRNDSIVTMFM